MIIDIPSAYRAFQLRITLKNKIPEPIYVRLMAVDPNKPYTKYVDRGGEIAPNSSRTFYMKFPVSPAEMKAIILNPKVGNAPIGQDPTFEIEDFGVEKLPEYDVWWNQDTKNFYDFAVDFAQNAATYSASSNMKPHIYRSDDGKFEINYYDIIRDKRSGKPLTTPARVGHQTGIIEVSKKKFLSYTVPARLVILLHEFAHKHLNPKINRKIDYETGADIQALYIYLGKGWSPMESHKAFLEVFENAKSNENHKRYKIIRDFIDKYDRGLVEQKKAA